MLLLPYETERITLAATAADSKARVEVVGGDELTAGADNTIRVICTAEDGTQKTYTVIARRAAAPEPKPTETQPAQDTAATQRPADDGQKTGIPWWLPVACAACLVIAFGVVLIIRSKKTH